MGLRDPSVFDELVTLWRMATASERVRFLAWIASAPDCQRSRLPVDSGPVPLVKLDPEPGR